METSLKDQGKNHRFHDVILVVGVATLLYPSFLTASLSAFSHLGTGEHGLLSLRFQKRYVQYRFYHDMAPQAPAESIDLFCVGISLSKVYGYGGQFKRLPDKTGAVGKSIGNVELSFPPEIPATIISPVSIIWYSSTAFRVKTEQLL